MADGTIKQINPLSGTEVWTIQGRANRPLEVAIPDPVPVAAEAAGQHCAFCSGRYLETPPEKARIVRGDDGSWQTLLSVPASKLFDTVAEFRRIPNLFEILSLEYWQANYGYTIPSQVLNRRDAYLTEDEGWEHVLAIVRTKLRASGFTNDEIDALDERTLISFADAFFASGHDVIVSRRHYAEGATSSADLASSGSLSFEEHRHYISMTAETMRDLYRKYPDAKYVAAFQNWLRPAGASFDHLHKQLVTIDERGVQAEREVAKVERDPEIYNRLAVDYAIAHRLVIAENNHAIAFAGFGHRFPTLEIYSKSAANFPWKHHPDAIAAMSDLIHACHVATGPRIASNEEWHYRPPDVETKMPWRVMLKWRVSTLAGFEGGTKINVNTIDPFTLAARALQRLEDNRDQIAPTIAIGPECRSERGALTYTEEK
ncbi:DUF4921 domain-containing protein [Bowdeniella nasicola]|uniref:DUF4921 domain-containing protein n=1 Tax=Bowdeniella nasicola TaxID=208480 RepID=A0A1Q5Q060_9ACTO|nr:DUF4921 family protein [Bowdeniella nasicola]OKL53258.1 DUF4921 domain-containing protein [Bowdeniella nasicola]